MMCWVPSGATARTGRWSTFTPILVPAAAVGPSSPPEDSTFGSEVNKGPTTWQLFANNCQKEITNPSS